MSARLGSPQGRIILVEDDEAVAGALTFVLVAEGFCVEAFSSAESLLKVAADRSPSCIILDQRLGSGLTGVAALKSLRQAGFDWPAILMTTHPSASLRASAAAAAAEIVEKPDLGDRLLAQVLRMVAGRGPAAGDT